MMTAPIRYIRYVSYSDIEDHLRLGWLPLIPNVADHHHAYGITMAWLCGCKMPIPAAPKENHHDGGRFQT